MSVTHILGACPHDCPDTCSLTTTVIDGVATKVQGNPDHPMTGGVLCAKVSKYTQRTYHADRVLQPLKRSGPKGSGQFTPVSWDEALRDIAQRLHAIAQRNPEAILPYSYAGTMGQVQGESMDRRFFHQLGASLLDRTICASAGSEALAATYGGKLGMRMEFFAESQLILIWGSNSIASNLHFWRLAQEAKRNGAKLVCIDPRKSETAEKCHEHLQLLPGTDAALALALMHELIQNDWLDHDYIAQHTLGWEALRARALEWPPERAAQVCGLPVEQIRQLARDYGTTRPAAIRLNYGMQRVRGGGNAVRAIACLPALVGAWRHRAGGLLLSSSGVSPFNKAALQLPQLLGNRHPRTLNMSTIGDVLLHPGDAQFGPQVEAVVVYNSNPVAVAPESAKVAAGFAREDLFTVVLEHFLTDTADHADYVLPATTQLEHWDIHGSYGHTDVLLNRQAIAPEGQARSNAQIFRDLAAQMAQLDPAFAAPHFSEPDEALCRTALAGTAMDFDSLLIQGFAHIPVAEAPFAQGGFATPSGKCEFDNPRLAALGINTLPDHVPNYEPPTDNYPLAMISPPARNFLNSTFANVASLARMEERPLLELHPEDAAARGIADGDRLRVFNARGSHVCHAAVNGRARPGVVVGLGIWWRKQGANGTNVNELTHQQLTDIGRAPCFYDCAVQVERLA
ncbi:molybdopterin-containing oxidoreductase family protein [Comamonas aquatica]|uniref:molybdopterin-containing oxidoreductase family protein n=1 Tax=Comamonas aquatica TaxID=225991 RepID=UPI00244CE05E|nr:molybdopterin oxidoreductase family protein [Comamonas aquatica]MDH0380683.1 molybdopterin oxidoreductase family protein [Comamonas aquatica]MDH0428659.1 molybdopterin oxidoreductase family protein [Comamonas aquatica]MDH0898518.1 molybdopterin oxidoreductase family protein [Comamonas aquatica]MDH0939779.1 molybdopterin oxidoreductase family protein [Comamonas aquatica]MDH1378214.1 molybdopterin oxidoreductase family protein [Comamonas aquatica]